MTASTFAMLCAEAGIDPAVALENAAIRAALKARDDKAVKRLLETAF